MMRIRRNDTVLVITGRDKGKKGTVIEVDRTKGLVKVAGIGMITKHQKARRQGETPAIKKLESFIRLLRPKVLLLVPSLVLARSMLKQFVRLYKRNLDWAILCKSRA